MIKDRIADFNSSPIYGVGFAAMENIRRSKVDFKKGIIESGSSWFLILGSTGALGLFFYILTLFANMRIPWKKSENLIIISCVCFFLAHSMVEGYIISFGAPQCALFWLFVGILRSHVDYNSKVN